MKNCPTCKTEMKPLFSSFFCPQCESTKASAKSKILMSADVFAMTLMTRLPNITAWMVRRWPHKDMVTVYLDEAVAPAKGSLGFSYQIAITGRGQPSEEDLDYWENLLS